MASRLIYCDTNVYLDYFWDRSHIRRPLGEFAGQVFRRAKHCEFILVVSDSVLREIEHCGAADHMQRLLQVFMPLGTIVFITATGPDVLEAQRLPTHRADALHVVLALKAGATCIVTNNIRDFLFCAKRINVVEPNLL